MKTIKYYMSMVAIFALLFTSCSTEDQSSDVIDGGDENSVVLTFNSMLNDLSNKAMQKAPLSDIPDCMDGTPTSVEITLWVAGEAAPRVVTVDVLGDATDGYFTAYSDLLKIKIANDGDDTTEDSVDFTLQGFKVFAGADLLWLAPVRTTSDVNQFAGYVEKSLPFEETVIRGSKPYFDVEVLCFDRRMVNEYGYPFFDLVPSKVYPLCFFVNYCVPNGKEYVGNYELDLFYIDGDTRIQLYGQTPTSPATSIVAGNPQADPLCVKIPESPGDGNDVFLEYTLTLIDWNATGSYGTAPADVTITKTLTWNEYIALRTGETMDYIHIRLGCDDNPGGGDDCASNGGDADGDGICDDIDDCVNGVGDGCPGGGDDCTSNGGDADGDGICDDIDDCIDVDDDGICDNEDCDYIDCDTYESCETAYMNGKDDELEFRDIYTGNGNGRWGWIAQGSDTYTLYAGAGNNYNKNMPVGTAVVTSDATNVYVTIDWEAGYEFTELHIDIFATMPTYNDLKAPGQYEYNESDNSSEMTYTYNNPTGDDSFYIVVHAKSCSLAD